MATRKYSLNLGESVVTESTGAAISGNDGIEVNVDLTKMERGQFAALLARIERYILENKWPPA